MLSGAKIRTKLYNYAPGAMECGSVWTPFWVRLRGGRLYDIVASLHHTEWGLLNSPPVITISQWSSLLYKGIQSDIHIWPSKQMSIVLRNFKMCPGKSKQVRTQFSAKYEWHTITEKPPSLWRDSCVIIQFHRQLGGNLITPFVDGSFREPD